MSTSSFWAEFFLLLHFSQSSQVVTFNNVTHWGLEKTTTESNKKNQMGNRRRREKTMQYITSVVCSYQICTLDWVRKVHTRSNIGAPNSDSFFPVNYCSMFSNLDDLVMVFDHFPSISENAFGTRYTKC